ncbi:hypothetical protein CQA53_11625, partial [Helicobacter didelphidarum]
SYWKFKEICEANYDILDSNERTKKLLNLFNVNDRKLEENLQFENNHYIARFRYDTWRIKSQLNIQLNTDKKIIKIYVGDGAMWYDKRPIMLGNEANMDFRIEWDNFLMCGNLDKRRK